MFRRYLSYQRHLPNGMVSPDAGSIASLVPPDGPYDMMPVIAALVDDGSFFELRPSFARAVLTGLARMAWLHRPLE